MDFKAKVEEVRSIFVRELAKIDPNSPTHTDDEAIFVLTEEIAGEGGDWEFLGGDADDDLYAVLRELSDEFEIEEEGGGFFVWAD